MSRKFPLVLLLLAISWLPAQTPTSARFASVFENPRVAVYSLELPPRFRAAVFQGTHDVFWVSLSEAPVTFAGHDRIETVDMVPGDVRFFPEFQLASVANGGGAPAKGILIELKARGGIPACGCIAAVERSVCGCAGGTHLPALWALGFGGVTLGGTTLTAGQAFLGSSYRDDMLLVAINTIDLKDDAASESTAIHLAAGEARWLPAAAHQFRNLAAHPARFMTIEF
jgi:hypothetical protein